MTHHLCHLTLLIFLGFLFCQFFNAQTKITNLNQLIIEVQEQEKASANCQPKGRRISHFCYDFCPTSLAKPLYPDEAKRMRISGRVKIEVIVNDNGSLIYAEVLEGKPYLSQSARQAAYRSSFQTRKSCDGKPIKFRGTIIYNFY